MDQPLADRGCVPCRGGVPPLAPEEVERLLAELNGGTGPWEARDAHHITRTWFTFSTNEGSALTNTS